MPERVARLRRREEFESVFASPHRPVVSTLFIVRACAREGGSARLGIVASRKAMARAVDRNQAKRMVRETFRDLRSELPAVDLVVQVRKAIGTSTRAAARRELTASLRSMARAWTR